MSFVDEAFKERKTRRSCILISVVDANGKNYVFGMWGVMGIGVEKVLDVINIGTTETKCKGFGWEVLKAGKVAVTNENGFAIEWW